ncbi:MAG: Loki-CTERM sorting domain-containing protein [Promethearchaeota archaeon]
MRSNRKKLNFVSLTILVCMLASSFYLPMVKSSDLVVDIPTELEDINVLTLVANSVGDNFLDVRDTLEGWNCTVTTIGRSPSVLTHGGTVVSVDLQAEDFDLDEDLSNYDLFFIPSGAWWQSIANNYIYTDFIREVYEHDSQILVGSMCIGCAILGGAEIVEGKKILVHGNGVFYITDAGGIYTSGLNVLSDERILTGATGSGVSGHENAPYQEFSQTVVKEVLGLSYFDNYTIEEVDNVPGSTHKMTVHTQTQYELDDLLTGVRRNISEVEVVFYPSNDRKDIIELSLDEVAENTFEGYIDEEVDGKYTVKVEVYNNIDECEIVTIDYGMRINSIPGFSIWIISLTGAFAIGILLLVTRKKIHKR